MFFRVCSGALFLHLVCFSLYWKCSGGRPMPEARSLHDMQWMEDGVLYTQIHTNISTCCRSSSRWISLHTASFIVCGSLAGKRLLIYYTLKGSFFTCITVSFWLGLNTVSVVPSEHRLWIKAGWIIVGLSLHWPFQVAVLCSGLGPREHVPIVSEQPGHIPLLFLSTLLIDWPGDIHLWRSQQKTPRVTNDPHIFHVHLPGFWHQSWKNKDGIWFYT